MNNSCPTRETMSIEEATVSDMWDIAAIVEVLERKGPARGKTSTTSSPGSVAVSA
jgi:hypothetical protein